MLRIIFGVFFLEGLERCNFFVVVVVIAVTTTTTII